MFEKETAAIQVVIGNYFHGIFHGDTSMLESAFHPQCLLFGDINGQAYLKTLPDYIEGVKNRKSPSELGETFRMKTLAVEILNNTATARLHTPMLGYNYYDFFLLQKLDDQWMITGKIFTNVTE